MTSMAKSLLLIILLVGIASATELIAPDGQKEDRFGATLSIDGNTLAITGAYEGDYPGGRTAWVYQKGADNSWSDPLLVAELTASNGDRLEGVAVSGNTIVVGAPAATVNGVQFQGCAYVFVESAGGWKNAHETAQLTSSDGYFNDGFGGSVAIQKDTIVVGASQAGTVGQGEAYVFAQPAAGWMNATETAKLLSSNGQQYDNFGLSVSVNGVVAAVGAPGAGSNNGAVYLFQETRGGWQNMTETAELTEDRSIPNEVLGFSVAIEGGTVVTGAPNFSGNTGRALIYLKPAAGWQSTTTPNAMLTSREVKPHGFGVSVAIKNKLIVVGDLYASAGSRKFSGAAFAYKKPVSGWSNAMQSKKFVAAGINTGESVGVSDDKTVFMGAPGTTVNGNQEQGAVFLQPF
jgi:FG-GAP repeat